MAPRMSRPLPSGGSVWCRSRFQRSEHGNKYITANDECHRAKEPSQLPRALQHSCYPLARSCPYSSHLMIWFCPRPLFNFLPPKHSGPPLQPFLPHLLQAVCLNGWRSREVWHYTSPCAQHRGFSPQSADMVPFLKKCTPSSLHQAPGGI